KELGEAVADADPDHDGEELGEADFQEDDAGSALSYGHGCHRLRPIILGGP
ncbi:hypothetical protein A2U01_0034316, partial [Trifolium medium]|nr:hypothetical protein [Trifolium medium]